MDNSVDTTNRQICPGTQPFIYNQWYAIAFPHEIEGDKPLHRVCMNEPIVLFRTETGEAAALHDRCPHRAVPLSLGKVVDGTLQCGYHGLRFAGSGQCTLIPTQDTIPAKAYVRSYPIKESIGFLWIWMGDPAKAEGTSPPGYEIALIEEDWQHSPYFMMEIKANYSMLFENLLDNTHISFLHIGGIDGGQMASTPFEVETEDNIVTGHRFLARDEANSGTAKLFSMPEGQVFSRRLASRSVVPNLHVVSNEIGFPDEPDRPHKTRVNVMPITPATSNSLYQFVIISTSYPVDVTQDLKDQLWTVFTQDREVLEAIQKGYDELGPDLNEVSLKADAAALRARRLIAVMAAEEQRSQTGAHA